MNQLQTIKNTTVASFQKEVLDYYQKNGRHALPWRILENSGQLDPYKIVVSELMLQQTQVSRVKPKFTEFIAKFPTFTALAEAPLSEVLKVWSGLGYNRRAKFLHIAAQKIVNEYNAVVPDSVNELTTLPGIGANTAAAIVTYSYNIPLVYIETNIRTVFIHYFMQNAYSVDDKELFPLIARTLDEDNPREWYWALMDYGSCLKLLHKNPSRQSKHHTSQSKFQGSNRQLRGVVLKHLATKSQTFAELQNSISDKRLLTVLKTLQNEELISHKKNRFILGQ